MSWVILGLGDGYGDRVRVRDREPGHLGTFAGNPGHPECISEVMFVGIASLLMRSLLEPFIKDNSCNLLSNCHALLSLNILKDVSVFIFPCQIPYLFK